MKLRVISLIRDEIDIVSLFLKHLDALFDEVILVDHQSIDGTTDLLLQAVAQRPTWKYYRVNIKQYLQMQLMNFFIEKFRNEQFDFLFFLDSDEFLQVKDRQALENLLTCNQNEVGVYGFKWVNSIPKKLNSSKPLDTNTDLFISSDLGGWQKVALNWKQIDTSDLYVIKGNHKVFHRDGQPYPNGIVGNILHIPIRSKSQFTSKALLGQCSLLLEANRIPAGIFQYNRFVERIAKNELKDSDLIRCLYYYQIGDDPIPEGWEDEFLRQCQVQKIKRAGIALSDQLKLKMPKKATTIERKIANALLNASVIDPTSCTLSLKDETISLVMESPEGTDLVLE